MMKLQFDFSVDKKNNSIIVKRAFDAAKELVWEAWTKPELLEQWWAPKPYKTISVSMDFSVGGSWFYYMLSPEGEKHYCLAEYKNIAPYNSFSGLDAFCDAQRVINKDFPRSLWNVNFSKQQDQTLVDVLIQYDSLEDLEKIITLGFKEGFSMALGNLDQYLEAQVKLRVAMKKDKSVRVCNYLNFPGNTEEAFLFYKKVFRSEFSANGIQRFGELPADAAQAPLAESVKNMVLHVELPILGNHVLMGTDAPKEMGFTVQQGNNMHISLEPESKDEAQRIFDELSVNGKISMPLQDMFWGAFFGSFTDQFGINWMVNYVHKK